MPFENPPDESRRTQAERQREKAKVLERLQSLQGKERLVFLDLVHRLGATNTREVSTNFLSQYQLDDLHKLDRAWEKVSQDVSDFGGGVSDLSDEQIEGIVTKVIEQHR